MQVRVTVEGETWQELEAALSAAVDAFTDGGEGLEVSVVQVGVAEPVGAGSRLYRLTQTYDVAPVGASDETEGMGSGE